MSGKMHIYDRRGHAFKSWVAITPLIGATLIAVSRTMDYRHHATDVIAGGLLGTVIAVFTYHLCASLSLSVLSPSLPDRPLSSSPADSSPSRRLPLALLAPVPPPLLAPHPRYADGRPPRLGRRRRPRDGASSRRGRCASQRQRRRRRGRRHSPDAPVLGEPRLGAGHVAAEPGERDPAAGRRARRRGAAARLRLGAVDQVGVPRGWAAGAVLSERARAGQERRRPRMRAGEGGGEEETDDFRTPLRNFFASVSFSIAHICNTAATLPVCASLRDEVLRLEV